jgi:hypothetical protein
MAMGMEPSDVLQYYKEALPFTKQYQKDTEEAFAIDMRLSAMSHGERFVKGEALQQRKEQLMDSLARNPMHALMEAGAYVNIATQMGISSSEIKDNPDWMDKIRTARHDHLNGTVNKIIDEALLTEDSELYKIAVVGAQMTDFAARYALVRHLTQKGVPVAGSNKKRKYTQAEAIDVAMDVFVDFTGATSPEMQLANDLGIVMFSKFRLRLANSLLAAGEINPKGALGLGVLDVALKATDTAAGFTSATASMGVTGLLNTLSAPWETISHIADNTLFSYIPDVPNGR